MIEYELDLEDGDEGWKALLAEANTNTRIAITGIEPVINKKESKPKQKPNAFWIGGQTKTETRPAVPTPPKARPSVSLTEATRKSIEKSMALMTGEYLMKYHSSLGDRFLEGEPLREPVIITAVAPPAPVRMPIYANLGEVEQEFSSEQTEICNHCGFDPDEFLVELLLDALEEEDYSCIN